MKRRKKMTPAKAQRPQSSEKLVLVFFKISESKEKQE